MKHLSCYTIIYYFTPIAAFVNHERAGRLARLSSLAAHDRLCYHIFMHASKTATAVIFLKGSSSIIVQTLFLRELFVLFYGNELIFGILLAVWLAAGGAGNMLARRWNRHIKDPRAAYSLVLIFSVAWLPLALIFIRLCRQVWGVGIGETFGLAAIFLSSMATLGVSALCDGALFACGFRLMGSMTRLYAWEAIGIIIGAIAFTLSLLASINPFAIIFLLVAVNMAGLWLLLKSKDTLHLKNTIAISLAIALVGLAASDVINKKTLAWPWRGRTITHHKDSVYGQIVVTREKNQRTVFYDGLPLVSLPHPDLYFTSDFIHLALLHRPNSKNILFVGTAGGGLLAEAMKYPIEKIVYADTDPALISILKKMDNPLTKKEFADPRLVIAIDDGRHFLTRNREAFDIVFIPAGLPTSLVANRYQTLEFFLKVQKALSYDGIAVFKTAGSLAYLNRELKHINATLLKTLAAVFKVVRVVPGDGYNIFLASNTKIDLDPAALSKNIGVLREPAPLIQPAYLAARLDKGYSDWFLANIKDELIQTPVNQDIRPSALYDGLGLYYAQFSKKIPALLSGLKDRRWRWALLTILALFLITRRWTHRRSQRPALLSWLAACAGFTGMASQILCLLLFQSIVGRLFAWLALLGMGFMAGASLGAITVHRNPKMLVSFKQLARMEALLGLLTMGWLIGIAVGYEKTGLGPAWIFWINSFVAGYSVGIQLPIIFSLGLLPGHHQEEAGRWAGRINGLDLWGACGATLLVPLFLLPGYGLITTAACIILLRLTNTWNILRSAELD